MRSDVLDFLLPLTSVQRITSPQNQRIKDAARLTTSRGRNAQGRIAVYGVRESLRALQSDAKPVEAIVCSEITSSENLAEVQAIQKHKPFEILDLPRDLFKKTTYGDRTDGLITIFERPTTKLGSIENTAESFHVIVESVEKPGNLGAIVRTADAVGASSVIVADPLTDFFHPNSIRASLGCVFAMPKAVATAEQVIDWLTQNRIKTMMAIVGAQTLYHQADYSGNIAIVLGNEAQGLSQPWNLLLEKTELKIDGIRLPMCGLSDSLNVSTTAAVLCYEALRQRGLNNMN